MERENQEMERKWIGNGQRMWKWRENEKMKRKWREREWGNGEEIALHCWQPQFTAFLVSVAKILTYAV